MCALCPVCLFKFVFLIHFFLILFCIGFLSVSSNPFLRQAVYLARNEQLRQEHVEALRALEAAAQKAVDSAQKKLITTQEEGQQALEAERAKTEAIRRDAFLQADAHTAKLTLLAQENQLMVDKLTHMHAQELHDVRAQLAAQVSASEAAVLHHEQEVTRTREASAEAWEKVKLQLMADHHGQLEQMAQQQQDVKARLTAVQQEAAAEETRMKHELAQLRVEHQLHVDTLNASGAEVLQRCRAEVDDRVQRLSTQHTNDVVTLHARHQQELAHMAASTKAELDVLTLQHSSHVSDMQRMHAQALAALTYQLRDEHASEMAKLESRQALAVTAQQQLLAETMTSQKKVFEETLASQQHHHEQSIAALQAQFAQATAAREVVHQQALAAQQELLQSTKSAQQQMFSENHSSTEKQHAQEVAFLHEQHAQALKALHQKHEDRVAMVLAQQKAEFDVQRQQTEAAWVDKVAKAATEFNTKSHAVLEEMKRNHHHELASLVQEHQRHQESWQARLLSAQQATDAEKHAYEVLQRQHAASDDAAAYALRALKADHELEVKGLREQHASAVAALQVKVAAFEKTQFDIVQQHARNIAAQINNEREKKEQEKKQLNAEHQAARLQMQHDIEQLQLNLRQLQQGSQDEVARLSKAMEDARLAADQKFEAAQRTASDKLMQVQLDLDLQLKRQSTELQSETQQLRLKRETETEQLMIAHKVEVSVLEQQHAVALAEQRRALVEQMDAAAVALRSEHAATMAAANAKHAQVLATERMAHDEALTRAKERQAAEIGSFIESSSIQQGQHSQVIESLKKQHADAMSEALAQQQAQAFDRLQAQLRTVSEQYEVRLDELRTQHATAMEALKVSHLQQLQDRDVAMQQRTSSSDSMLQTRTAALEQALREQSEASKSELIRVGLAADERVVAIQREHFALMEQTRRDYQSQIDSGLAELQAARQTHTQKLMQELDAKLDVQRQLGESQTRLKMADETVASIKAKLEQTEAHAVELNGHLQAAKDRFAASQKQFAADKETMLEHHDQATKTLLAAHAAAIKKLETDHAAQLEEVTQAHSVKVLKVCEEHEEVVKQSVMQVTSVEGALQAELRQLKEDHVAVLKTLKADSDQALATCQQEVLDQQDKFSKMVASLQQSITQHDTQSTELRNALDAERLRSAQLIETQRKDASAAQVKALDLQRQTQTAEHTRTVTNLTEQHKHELDTLKAKAEQELQREVTKWQLDLKRSEHELEALRMSQRGQHTAALESLHIEHAEALAALRAAHSKEQEQQQALHTSELDRCKIELELLKQQLQAQVMAEEKRLASVRAQVDNQKQDSLKDYQSTVQQIRTEHEQSVEQVRAQVEFWQAEVARVHKARTVEQNQRVRARDVRKEREERKQQRAKSAEGMVVVVKWAICA